MRFFSEMSECASVAVPLLGGMTMGTVDGAGVGRVCSKVQMNERRKKRRRKWKMMRKGKGKDDGLRLVPVVVTV